MLEEKIDALIIALNENTAAILSAKGQGKSVDELKASIAASEQQMHSDGAAEEKGPAKASKKKASKKSGKKTAPAEETPAPMDADKVQAHLRGIASQLTDTSKLFALIQKHGGQQFSDLDASVYEALVADAEQLVVDGA